MVHFQFQKTFNLKHRRKLKQHIEFLIFTEGYTTSDIQIIFCSDNFLLEINKDFLNHDYYTDIITFGEIDKENSISGELYISIDRVKENSIHFGKIVENELHRVIFHGLLHLCGYGDKTKKEISEMRKKEDFYLNSFK